MNSTLQYFIAGLTYEPMVSAGNSGTYSYCHFQPIRKTGGALLKHQEFVLPDISTSYSKIQTLSHSSPTAGLCTFRPSSTINSFYAYAANNNKVVANRLFAPVTLFNIIILFYSILSEIEFEMSASDHYLLNRFV